MCLSWCATYLVFGGRYAVADALLDAIGEVTGLSLQARALLEQTRSIRALSAGDPGACLSGIEAALAAYEQAGDRRNGCASQVNLGYIFAELGDFEGAEEALRAALGSADRMGLTELASTAAHNLGRVLAYRGRLKEARDLERRSIDDFCRQGNPRLEGSARVYLAEIELMSGALVTAEREARAAVEALREVPPLRAVGSALLGRILLAQGRDAEALSAARAAFSELEALGEVEEGESLVRLVHAQALARSGAVWEFREAIAAARVRLLERAARIREPGWRERFLTGVPDNAETLALAARAAEV